GILITLGLCTGLVFHTCLVAFGVATIMQTSDWALSALKIIGAIYLVYLAWQILNSQTQELSGKGVVLSDANLYLRGIVMNVTNPKVSIFFLAFLPQFASSNYGAITPQIILLGAMFGVVSLFIFSGISILASKLGDWLKRKPNAQVYLSRTTALIFVVLACNLLIGLTH
ncbi:MAG TPA: threonine transporter RhtB, partial [Methylophaga sp.]|nr:threonine transporter RhtB [Methylophaga sp.]